MARHEGLIHSKLPPGATIPLRDTGALIRTEDEDQFSPEFVAKGLNSLREVMGEIARQAENHSYPVDEYNTTPITGASTESVVTVLPTYEYWPEKIQAIIVAGPPAAAVTITLGDRQWPIILPPLGLVCLGPMAIFLGRSDTRQLVAQTPGIYFLELMGVADKRFGI